MNYMDRWLDALPSERAVEPLPITIVTDDVGLGETDPRAVFTGDGRRWWAKFASAPPGPRSLAVEHIVGRLGSMIGAPVCEVAVLQPSDDLVADLGLDLAHGSLDVEGATNGRWKLDHRDDDDNRAREVGIRALYDWCFGCDEQWLYDPQADWRVYSHDHGRYLPWCGQDWSIEQLLSQIDEPHELSDAPLLLPAMAVDGTACALERITSADIVGVLAGVPNAWLQDEDLAAVGAFLDERRLPTVGRLRRLADRSL